MPFCAGITSIVDRSLNIYIFIGIVQASAYLYTGAIRGYGIGIFTASYGGARFRTASRCERVSHLKATASIRGVLRYTVAAAPIATQGVLKGMPVLLNPGSLQPFPQES